MDLVPSPEDKFQEPSRRKASVWKRLASLQDHAMSEEFAVADNKMCTRPMRKKRRSKHGKGTAAQDLGPTQPCPPPPQLDCFRPEMAWPPSASSCVLEFSEDLAREEIALRRALFVSVTGSRPGVSGSDVLKEVRHRFGVKLEDMRIHQTYPEDFLLFLPDEDTATKVLNEGRPLRGPRFSLLLKRWSRFAHASSSSMAELVVVRLTGIPQHAWSRSTAEQLLRDSCWVEALHSEALEMRDFSVLMVKAWCFDPEKLVRKMDLHILEAGIDDQEKRFLTYKISIDILPPKTLQMASATPPPPPPPPSGREPDDDDPEDQDPQHRRRPVPVDLRRPVHMRLGPRPPLGRAHAVIVPPVRVEVEEDLGENVCVSFPPDAGINDIQLGGTLGQATSSPHLGTFVSGPLEILCHDSPHQEPYEEAITLDGPLGSFGPSSPHHNPLDGTLEMTNLNSPHQLSPIVKDTVIGSLGLNKFSSPTHIQPEETLERIVSGSPHKITANSEAPTSVSYSATFGKKQTSTSLKVYTRKMSRNKVCQDTEVVQVIVDERRDAEQVLDNLAEMEVVSSDVEKQISCSSSEYFLNRVAIRPAALLPNPCINVYKKASSPLSSLAVPRRSRRVAGVGVEFNMQDLGRRSMKKAMATLHIISETEGISQEAIDAYAKLFSQPLSQCHVEALAALFGWSAPSVLEP